MFYLTTTDPAAVVDLSSLLYPIFEATLIVNPQNLYFHLTTTAVATSAANATTTAAATAVV